MNPAELLAYFEREAQRAWRSGIVALISGADLLALLQIVHEQQRLLDQYRTAHAATANDYDELGRRVPDSWRAEAD